MRSSPGSSKVHSSYGDKIEVSKILSQGADMQVQKKWIQQNHLFIKHSSHSIESNPEINAATISIC